MSSKDFCYLLFSLSVACFFAYLTFGYTTEEPITKDAHQTARAAYHLVHTGVMGAESVETANPTPQLRREPIPILAIAGFLLALPDFDKPYTIAELTSGPLAKTIKGSVNAFWRFLAALFIFLLCWELFSDRFLSAAMALVCLAVSEVVFFAHPRNVDRLFTEIPAAALILVASWSAVRFVRTKSIGRAVWLGVALGALALTKAAFLYIGIGFVALLVALEGVRLFRADTPSESLRKVFAAYAMLILAMLAVDATWIVRNYAGLGKPQMSNRADSILGYRLLLAEQPLLGQVYVFSPSGLRRVIGPWIGYAADDLKIGGRLEGLVSAQSRPADVLKERMKAERFEGDENNWLRRAALDFVIQHPLRYIASIGVFACKGMLFMRNPALQNGIGGAALIAFNAVTLLCFLGLFLGTILAGNQVLVAAFGLGAGSFFFMSMFTNALPRFNAPLTPLVVLSFLWLLTALAWGTFGLLPKGWRTATRFEMRRLKCEDQLGRISR